MPIINELEKHIQAAQCGRPAKRYKVVAPSSSLSSLPLPSPSSTSPQPQPSHSPILHVKKLILFAFRHITLNMHVDPASVSQPYGNGERRRQAKTFCDERAQIKRPSVNINAHVVASYNGKAYSRCRGIHPWSMIHEYTVYTIHDVVCWRDKMTTNFNHN